jgi:hypothetical protein
MSEESSHIRETRDIVWDAREGDTQIEKPVSRPINPASIALLLGTGAFLLFCQAFLRRLAQRFGEDSANHLVDQFRDLGGRVGKLQLSRDSSSERRGNGIRQMLSHLTIGGSKRVPHGEAGQTQAVAADSDPLIYRIVVISISHFGGRRKS